MLIAGLDEAEVSVCPLILSIPEVRFKVPASITNLPVDVPFADPT